MIGTNIAARIHEQKQDSPLFFGSFRGQSPVARTMSKLIIKSGVHVTKIKFCHQNGAGIRRSCLPWVLDGRPAKPTNKQASSREPPDAPHGFEPRTINLPPRDVCPTQGLCGPHVRQGGYVPIPWANRTDSWIGRVSL
jgi:hypothetical protein